MKLLMFQAKRFWWKSFSKTLEDTPDEDVEETVTDALVVFFQKRESMTTGQKAQAIPDQAKSTNQNTNLLSERENQKAPIPTMTVIIFPKKTSLFWLASGLTIFW